MPTFEMLISQQALKNQAVERQRVSEIVMLCRLAAMEGEIRGLIDGGKSHDEVVQHLLAIKSAPLVVRAAVSLAAETARRRMASKGGF